jgi:hypothetical protein
MFAAERLACEAQLRTSELAGLVADVSAGRYYDRW